jgi:hypothetical protein
MTRPSTRPLVLYGDFTCPWSYLASRRVDALTAGGVEVDWRAVESRAPGRSARSGDRFTDLRADMELVVSGLLADERLPYCLAGFLPATTTGAVTGYAEAYAAGAAAPVRQLLFDAFWVHGCDLGDARLVRTLVVDSVRSGSAPGTPRGDWGYPLTARGGPGAATARELVARWTLEWRAAGIGRHPGPGPVLLHDAAAPLRGAAAVAWLGEELTRRGLDPATATPHASGCPGHHLDALPHAG